MPTAKINESLEVLPTPFSLTYSSCPLSSTITCFSVPGNLVNLASAPIIAHRGMFYKPLHLQTSSKFSYVILNRQVAFHWKLTPFVGKAHGLPSTSLHIMWHFEDNREKKKQISKEKQNSLTGGNTKNIKITQRLPHLFSKARCGFMPFKQRILSQSFIHRLQVLLHISHHLYVIDHTPLISKI